jgi:hypothetical protein
MAAGCQPDYFQRIVAALIAPFFKVTFNLCHLIQMPQLLVLSR